MNNKFHFHKIIILLFINIFFFSAVIKSEVKDIQDITWNYPSLNSSESMPLGGGDIGCNVWVENGDILLYFQRSGCFDATGEYLKLGRLRISFSPNPFLDFKDFEQQLNLKNGNITIKCKNKSYPESIEISLLMWVDIFSHSLHVESSSNKALEMKVAYESWRTSDKYILDDKKARFSSFSFEEYPGDVLKKKDSIDFMGNSILFFHENGDNAISPNLLIDQQGLTKFKNQITDKNSNLIFGGILSGTDLQKDSVYTGVYQQTPYKAWTLKSNKPSVLHKIVLASHVEQNKSQKIWQTNLMKLFNNVIANNGNFEENQRWWLDFWERSWIITDPDQRDADSLIWQMGRNYQLMRYQLGCNIYGEYPTKFNGGNFTFDPVLVDEDRPHDPDWRAWGGDIFTAQNQRLLYWPMLKSGDADGMKAQFNLFQWGLHGAKLRVKEYFGHNGAMFCEYTNAAGVDFGAGWGWSNAKTRKRGNEIPFGDKQADGAKNYGDPVEKGIMANGYVSYHWESQVEAAYMMLEYNRFTGINIDHYMPFIKNALIFFDEHYQLRNMIRDGKPLDENGKLVLYPSTSCESYRGAKNPVDLLSGLYACIEALLVLKTDSLSIIERDYFSGYLDRLPNLSFSRMEDDEIILPAESYAKYSNVECPQFYPLFPFNRFDIQNDTMSIFRNSWKHGTFPKNMIVSWHQDGIFFARMGLTEDALDYNKKKLQNSPRRFPTFWGPGHDWVPDHNWGGSGMIGLQEMLMQTVSNKIHLLPAWPKDKDVYFKLHAPFNTVIEMEYKGGVVKKLEITPKYREKDIIVNL